MKIFSLPGAAPIERDSSVALFSVADGGRTGRRDCFDLLPAPRHGAARRALLGCEIWERKMPLHFGRNASAVIKFSALGLLVGAAFSAGRAASQRAAPTDNRGVKGEVLATIDLGKEIECLAGRQLRMRKVTIDAGGYAGLHDHRNRPTVVYVRDGVIADYPGGGDEAKEYAAGQAFVEGAGGLRHWVENRSATPVVLIGVDIFKPQ